MQPSLKKYTGHLAAVVIITLFITALWQLASAGWIQGKAFVAQQLLQYSWQQTLLNSTSNTNKNNSVKPWPWADTWPLAKLIIPQHKVEQIIVAGDSGSSLAFAPGHSFAGALPNTPGLAMISAHRDTHFRFLKNIKIKDLIYIQTADKTVPYEVYDMQVVNSETFRIKQTSNRQTLVLATCFPFNSLTSGGKYRYLVYASPLVDLYNKSNTQRSSRSVTVRKPDLPAPV